MKIENFKNLELQELEVITGGVHGPDGCIPNPFPGPTVPDMDDILGDNNGL